MYLHWQNHQVQSDMSRIIYMLNNASANCTVLFYSTSFFTSIYISNTPTSSIFSLSSDLCQVQPMLYRLNAQNFVDIMLYTLSLQLWSTDHITSSCSRNQWSPWTESFGIKVYALWLAVCIFVEIKNDKLT